MIVVNDPSVLWVVILAFILAFILSFGVGANDVANSFGTSVGSGVLTLRQACILATIFEMLGSCLLGSKVAATLRLGVFDINIYADHEKLLMLGYLSALFGAALWNVLATFARLPISGTHSIVGAVLGFTLVLRGFNGLKWQKLSTIVLSWFISPLLSGAISVVICLGITKFILSKEDALERGLKSLPLFYGGTLFVNLFSIIHDGPKFFYLDTISWWVSAIVATIISLIGGVLTWIFLVPYQKKAIDKSLALQASLQKDQGIKTSSEAINQKTNASDQIPLKTTKVLNGLADESQKNNVDSEKAAICHKSCHEKPEISALFKYLQILTACFGSFAHGANDVSNAIGPLIAIVIIWNSGNVYQRDPSPFALLFYGGIGISVGLIVWGRRVIQTIGTNLSRVTPSTGFTVEVGSALTVLLASKIGLPISTTQCKVGSVVLVGKFATKESHVDWSLFKNIFVAWIFTVPVTAVFSGLSMLLLFHLVPGSMKSRQFLSESVPDH